MPDTQAWHDELLQILVSLEEGVVLTDGLSDEQMSQVRRVEILRALIQEHKL